MARQKQPSTPSSTTSDLSEDPDAEEALKGFDFLASPDELDGSAAWRSGEDDWGEGLPVAKHEDRKWQLGQVFGMLS